ncbi:AgmX/PglI C-terminal domain-containing protein [Nannocystis bainbridge]|uniref:AgmX/PglI C-terminal domain-containing protein n=1 Tax=Nannocystis bainbridge TaxID=2995303 RepID=A0ABT5DZ84_9BACT|nr:AgmX/PglI C-terminal domain-containing protein [Nannocystis bainbridge]MDC0717766.1 AgmX/PglI C-terminal domain-containing protein [Nannocystis bainbridge]
MTTSRTPWTLALCLASLVALPSCKKEATTSPDGDGGNGDAAAGDGGGNGGGGGGSGDVNEEPLTADSFEEAMQAKQGDVADCFAQAKAAKPELAGKLAIDVTVAGDGTVSAIKFTDSSTIKEASITSCIEEKARGWKFGKTSDGNPMTLGYSLNLS